MTLKEEFKLVKKILRKHGCLRAYRRMLRKELNLTLFEDVLLLYDAANGPYVLWYPKVSTDFWLKVDRDLRNHQLRYQDNK